MPAGFDPFDHDNEFSRSWWEGLIAHAPSPEWAQRFQAWRFADELMERYYVDVGLQAILGWQAEDAPGVHLASPGCLQAPRYFGYCDGAGLSTGHDLADRVNVGLDGVKVVPVCCNAFDDDEASDDYYRLEPPGRFGLEALEALGLDYGGEDGHEHCEHRRVESSAHLAFRFALLARLHRWFMDDFAAGFIASLPSRATIQHELSGQAVLKGQSANLAWLSQVEGSDPRAPGAPWAYVVFPSRWEGLRVFRFDGVLEGGSVFDGGSLLDPWRQGMSLTNILTECAFDQ